MELGIPKNVIKIVDNKVVEIKLCSSKEVAAKLGTKVANDK